MTIDIEGEARSILASAGYEPDDVPGGLALAEALEIPVDVFDSRILRGADALRFTLRGRETIAIRRGLSPQRKQWCVAHELAELHLRRLDYRQEDVEHVAHALAAALLMPRESFRVAAREHGLDIGALAADYLCDQTAAAMRLAETWCVDAAAVVTPTRVYVRAPVDTAFVLPGEPGLRRAARDGHPGLVRVPLTDARRRVALVAA